MPGKDLKMLSRELICGGNVYPDYLTLCTGHTLEGKIIKHILLKQPQVLLTTYHDLYQPVQKRTEFRVFGVKLLFKKVTIIYLYFPNCFRGVKLGN